MTAEPKNGNEKYMSNQDQESTPDHLLRAQAEMEVQTDTVRIADVLIKRGFVLPEKRDVLLQYLAFQDPELLELAQDPRVCALLTQLVFESYLVAGDEVPQTVIDAEDEIDEEGLNLTMHYKLEADPIVLREALMKIKASGIVFGRAVKQDPVGVLSHKLASTMHRICLKAGIPLPDSVTRYLPKEEELFEREIIESVDSGELDQDREAMRRELGIEPKPFTEQRYMEEEARKLATREALEILFEKGLDPAILADKILLPDIRNSLI
jgi:hypothetical protein